MHTIQPKLVQADLVPDKQSTIEYICLRLMVNKERNLLFRVGCACSVREVSVEWRECEESVWRVCVNERRVHVVCVWRVCVWVKREHTGVCRSVGVREGKAHRRAEGAGECRVCAASSCEWMSEREREQRMREKRNFKPWKTACQLVPKKVVCVYLLFTFQISLLPVENSDPVSRLDTGTSLHMSSLVNVHCKESLV